LIRLLERRALAGLLGALLLILAFEAASWRSVQAIGAGALQDQRLKLVRTEAQSLQAYVASAVVAQHGYALTGEARYEATFDSLIAKLPAATARLRAVAAAAGLDTAYLVPLEALVTARLALASQIVAVRRANGLVASRGAVSAGRGMELDAAIEQRVGDVDRAVTRRIERELRDTARSARQTVTLALAGSGTSVLLLLMAFGVLRRDLRERQDAHDRLLESERRFEELAATIGEVFWISDAAKTRMLYVSPGYDAIWGRSHRELYRQPMQWVDAIHPDDRERVMAAALTRQVDGTYSETYRIVHPAEGVRWIHDRAYPVRNSRGEVERVVGVARDITSQRQLAEQLQQAQKLEAVGRLAGGIAHDFNNLLTVILSYSDLLHLRLPEELRSDSDAIRGAAERARDLTRQLLSFSRQQVLAPAEVDLPFAVNSVALLLRRVIGEPIDIQVITPDTSVAIQIDPVQLEQILLNLAVNAKDAMPEGGRLDLRVHAETLATPVVHEGVCIAPGQYAVLSVTDTGIGMDAETLSHLFEPFYTTKPPGKGTGLGLSTVYGIVKQSGGEIWVYSEPGRGTTFRIWFPLAPEAAVTDSAPAAELPSLPRGQGEHVLLVEDEASLRGVTHRILTGAGYHVTAVASAEEALQRIDTLDRPPQLLISDVVLPGLSGPRLARLLVERRPTLRILFISGYVPESAGLGESLDPNLLVEKPYTVDSLLRRVALALESGPG
jgi:PAS domain S-box-containing protein